MVVRAVEGGRTTGGTGSIIKEAAAGRARIVGLTVEQYDSLVEHGFLDEDPTTELIDGLIVRKDRAKDGEDPLTVGDRHRMAVQALSRMIPLFDAYGCFLQVQQPIAVPPNNEPEPDGAVIIGVESDYADRKPSASDVLSVIEVADSSRWRDLNTKLRIYARAGVPQYVVANLVRNVVLVHTEPAGEAYGAIATLTATDTLHINAGAGRFVPGPATKLLP